MGLVAIAVASAQHVPTEQTQLYYNARIAVREGRPHDAIALWLARNTLHRATDTLSVHDADFLSTTWVAADALGLCTDGLPRDGAAGLWPLVLHNAVVREEAQPSESSRTNPFSGLAMGRIDRPVSWGSTPTAVELSALHVQPTPCAMLLPMDDDARRERAIRLLEHARETVSDAVLGRTAIEARLIDLYVEKDDSKAQELLEQTTRWSADGWLALSADRRLALFDRAYRDTDRQAALDGVAAEVVMRLAQKREGTQLSAWLARCGDSVERRTLWGGGRGEALMALGPDTGFTERSALALHRGVWEFRQGSPDSAARAFAKALSHAPESQDPDGMRALALRWLTYVLDERVITSELLDTLRTDVPDAEREDLLEALLWSAALRGDRWSFARGLTEARGHRGLHRRLRLLEPLAAGDLSGFIDNVSTQLDEAPGASLDVVEAFVLNGRRVDSATTATVAGALVALLDDVDADAAGARDHARMQALVASLRGMSQTARPAHTAAFAGAVRLPPSDPLPWFERGTEVPSPSAYAPLTLTPLEWQGPEGIVFAWKVSE